MDDGLELIASEDSEQFESLTLVPFEGESWDFEAAVFADRRCGLRLDGHHVTTETEVYVFARKLDLPDDYQPQIRDMIFWGDLKLNYVDIVRQDRWHYVLAFKAVERTEMGNSPGFRH